MSGEEMKRSTVILSALLAVVIAAIGFSLGRTTADDQRNAAPATRFVGTIVSLYPDRTGGCVQANAGQGVETAKDAHCGTLYASGVRLATGTRVTAVEYSMMLRPDGEALQGLLLSPEPR